jgi:hypothetical protein
MWHPSCYSCYNPFMPWEEFGDTKGITRSLVLYVCFVDRCLSFCTFSFGHCVVCSPIYGFWLPLWYLQTLLIRIRKNQRKTDNTMARRQRTKDIKGGLPVEIKETQTRLPPFNIFCPLSSLSFFDFYGFWLPPFNIFCPFSSGHCIVCLSLIFTDSGYPPLIYFVG